MSSFLSAAENVARQRQNVQRDLTKMEEESRAVELALEGHIVCLFLVHAAHEKCFCYNKIIIFIF